MKKSISIILLWLISITAMADSPKKISYQAVVRNTKGELMTNKTVGVKISIYYYATKTATVTEYAETHSTLTNGNGLMTVDIGTGTVVTGTFANLNWATRTYYIKTEIDTDGGTRYNITSDTQILSVPYALHATSASELKYKTIPLNIYSAYLPDNKASFGTGFGTGSCISFPDTQISNFNMSFTLPRDYVTGDPIKIRLLVSATNTGAVTLSPNSISVLRAGYAALAGTTVSTGLSMNAINITTANIIYEVFGGIESPLPDNPLVPGDGICFSFFRNYVDANTGTFKIHGIEIRY